MIRTTDLPFPDAPRGMIDRGLAGFRQRRVLMLQGPIGPFFSRLARDLADAGAVVLLPQHKTDADQFAAQLTEVLMQPGKLKAMGATARRLAKPDATRTVVGICLEVAHV